MYLIYFDEVKDRPHKQRYYRVGALAIPIDLTIAIEKKVSELSNDVFGSPLLSEDTEFHGNPLLCGKGLFKNFDSAQRQEIYQKLLAIIDSFEEIFKISIRVDSKKYYASIGINEMAFIFLVEKANELMRENDSVGLLIGDYDDPIIDASVKQLSEYREIGTPYKSRNIKNLIDTVHYAKSHHSRFIQLADIYVHSLQLQEKKSTQSISRGVQEFIRSLENRFPQKWKHWPQG